MYYQENRETRTFYNGLKDQQNNLDHNSSFLKRRYLPESRISEMLWIIKNKLKEIEKCKNDEELNKHIKMKKVYNANLSERMDY